MTDYTKLVKALRHCMTKEDGITICEPCPYYGKGIECENVLHTDAAAAIEALQALYRQMDKRNTDLHNEGYDVGYWAGKRDAEAAQPHWVSTDELPKEKGWYYLGYLSKWNGQEWWVPQFPDYWTKPPQEVQE